MALMKYCNRNGCSKLVPQGVRYCTAHTMNRATENKERHKEYDAHCRNQIAKAFYNSGEWRAAREIILSNYFPTLLTIHPIFRMKAPQRKGKETHQAIGGVPFFFCASFRICKL